MVSQDDLRKTSEKYAEQMLQMAVETGTMLDAAFDTIRKNTHELASSLSEDTKGYSKEIKRLSQEMSNNAMKDLPKIRQELKDMETKARERLRELNEKM